MNWQTVAVIIDILTVLMALVMAVVLYVAHKSYKKVKVLLDNISTVFNPVQEEDGSD